MLFNKPQKSKSQLEFERTTEIKKICLNYTEKIVNIFDKKYIGTYQMPIHINWKCWVSIYPMATLNILYPPYYPFAEKDDDRNGSRIHFRCKFDSVLLDNIEFGWVKQWGYKDDNDYYAKYLPMSNFNPDVIIDDICQKLKNLTA
jgi:hypothetical protein